MVKYEIIRVLSLSENQSVRERRKSTSSSSSSSSSKCFFVRLLEVKRRVLRCDFF